MTTNTIAVTLTAVLCTTISSAITTIVATAMCYCIMRKKKKGVCECGKHITPKAEPVYDTPQALGESSADIELKENTCYTSKLGVL